MKYLTLDRAALEHASLGRIKLIQAGCQHRLERWRNLDLAPCFTGHRHHLLDEERVAAGGVGDLRTQFARDVLGNQLFRLRRA